MWQPIQ